MSEKTECSCKKCVRACECSPGWFLPGEPEKAAETLGIPFDEFKKKLIKDHCSSRYADNAPYVWSPRKMTDADHEIRTHSEQREKGACVFLVEGKCSVHAAKPYECRTIFACDYRHDGIRDDIEKKYLDAGAPLGIRPEYDEQEEFGDRWGDI